MSVKTLVVLGSASTVNADTNDNPNTVVMRDNDGNIFGETVEGTNLETSGLFTGNVETVTSNTTLGDAWQYLVDCTGGAITITPPTASANDGVEYYVMKKDSSGNAVTLASVVGTTSLTSQYQQVRIFSDGTTWYAK